MQDPVYELRRILLLGIPLNKALLRSDGARTPPRGGLSTAGHYRQKALTSTAKASIPSWTGAERRGRPGNSVSIGDRPLKSGGPALARGEAN